MPAIAPDATRVNYKFKGKTVGVPTHYPIGHIMSENDSKFANRQLASVLGNVLASALGRLADKRTEDNKKLADTDTAKQRGPDGQPKVFTVDEITDDDAQRMFDAIYSNYEIGVNNNRGDGTGIEHDPVESIARNIAWERVKVLLKERKLKIGSVKTEKKNELVNDMLERDPSIRVAAKAQFEGAPTVAINESLFAGLAAADVAASTPGAASAEGTTVNDTNSTTVSGGAGSDTIAGPIGTDSVTGTTDAGNVPAVAEPLTPPTEPVPTVPGTPPSSITETGEPATPAPSGDATANPGVVSDAAEGTGQGTPAVGDAVTGAVDSGSALPNEPAPAVVPDVDPNSGVTSPGGEQPGGAFA